MQCAFERYHIRRAESEERRAIFLFATRSSPSALRLGAWVETPCLFGWHTLSCEVALRCFSRWIEPLPQQIKNRRKKNLPGVAGSVAF